MNRGAWHQFGWHSQKMIIEELQNDAGVGVIMSPRDLALTAAQNYVNDYSKLGASVLYDPQWHVPGFTNDQISSYPTNDIRTSVTTLGQIGDSELDDLRSALISENDSLGTDAIISPAVVYEAGRSDILQLNSKLHQIARQAGEQSNKPVYATVVLGQSVANSQTVTDDILSNVTGLRCDGWYFAFEFPEERIPSDTMGVYNCLRSILSLVSTGKPVLHGYAGPMGILSFAAGATGAAIGPSQKQWRFCKERWEDGDAGGGGGKAPERYFSRSLWGTIVVPDEIAMLSQSIKSQVVTPSPFAPDPLPVNWSRGDAQRHTVYLVCKGIEEVSNEDSPAEAKIKAAELLDTAIDLHSQIASTHISLKDNTASYQANWKAALDILHQNHVDDFDYLEMIG